MYGPQFSMRVVLNVPKVVLLLDDIRNLPTLLLEILPGDPLFLLFEYRSRELTFLEILLTSVARGSSSPADPPRAAGVRIGEGPSTT